MVWFFIATMIVKISGGMSRIDGIRIFSLVEPGINHGSLVCKLRAWLAHTSWYRPTSQAYLVEQLAKVRRVDA